MAVQKPKSGNRQHHHQQANACQTEHKHVVPFEHLVAVDVQDEAEETCELADGRNDHRKAQ